MRKFLRLTLVCLMAMVCGTVFAQDVILDFTVNNWNLPTTSNSKGKEAKQFSNGTYTVTLEAATSGYYFYRNTNGEKYNCLLIGKKDATVTLPAFDFAVDRIEVEGTSGASASVKQNIFVNGKEVCTETSGAKNVVNTYIIAPEYQAAGTIYTLKVTSSHNTQISSIKIYSTSAKKSADLKFSETTATVALNGDFTEPTLTKETSAEATYSSSDEDVATVDAKTGEVTLVGVGSTIITATTEENDEYSAGSASYTLNVTQPIVTETGIPYEESFADGIGSFTIDDVNLSDGLNYVWKYDDNYHYMKASAFVNGNKAAESWLVSPTINLENVSEATLAFEQCINKYFGTVENEATLWIKAGDAEWEQVTITYPTLPIPSEEKWSDWEKQTIDLEKYVGKKIKVGFKYVSTTEAAGTWEIRNFSVTGVATGITDITVEKEFDENAPIYNLSGQRVDKNAKGILIQNGKKFIRR